MRQSAGSCFLLSPGVLAWVCTTATWLSGSAAFAHETGASHIHFQRPGVNRSAPSDSDSGLVFRRASQAEAVAQSKEAAAQASAAEALPAARPLRQAVTNAPKTAPRATEPTRVVQQRSSNAVRPAYLEDEYDLPQPAANQAPPTVRQAVGREISPVSTNAAGHVVYRSRVPRANVLPTNFCESCVGDCTCEPACGIGEPACGIYEPGCAAPEACYCGEATCGICEPECGIYEPGCAVPGGCDCGEPSCGICEASCGLVEPACGCDGVGCGSCVGLAGPDYWCFPVCLPRFKDLTLWGGVHAFKGPRDSRLFGGPSDGNFGFQEGGNLGGRAPFIGLMFPQLSYQLGYQAVQSRISGTSDPAPAGSGVDRSQQFVTAGLFRRVKTGIQMGVVWDMMRDDLLVSEDFHQIRYELSLKSPRGREFGFMGTTHSSNKLVGGVDYQAVDQYALFYRWHFRNAGEGRLWGGVSNDDEGIFGGEFFVPLNNRWSLQSGFNYLITDRDAGDFGATEESWNLGMNLVWHFGRTARKCQLNPHRPLFQVADNGWMFIDEVP